MFLITLQKLKKSQVKTSFDRSENNRLEHTQIKTSVK